MTAGTTDRTDGTDERRREQRGWYFYDFANSAFATTIGGVLFGPYIKEIAEEAAVDNRIDVLFFSIAPGSLPPFIITPKQVDKVVRALREVLTAS